MSYAEEYQKNLELAKARILKRYPNAIEVGESPSMRKRIYIGQTFIGTTWLTAERNLGANRVKWKD